MGRTNNAIEVEILENMEESTVYLPQDIAKSCSLHILKIKHLITKMIEEGYIKEVHFSKTLASKSHIQVGYIKV